MFKCKECGQETPEKNLYKVKGVGIEANGTFYKQDFEGESIKSCIEQFVDYWSLDNAISINFTVIKRP